MNQNWSEQLMSVINQIAEKLGVAAEKLYPILRKQAMIDGFISIILLILGIVALYFMIKLFAKAAVKEKECRYNDGEKWFTAQLLLGVGIAMDAVYLLINIITINDIFTALFNPDWYIINNILGQLVK